MFIQTEPKKAQKVEMITVYKYSSGTFEVEQDPYLWASQVPAEDVSLTNRLVELLADIQPIKYKEDF